MQHSLSLRSLLFSQVVKIQISEKHRQLLIIPVVKSYEQRSQEINISLSWKRKNVSTCALFIFTSKRDIKNVK